MSPQRVPIIIPPNGVNPIDVFNTLPFLIAVIEAPLPRWHVIMFNVLTSLPINSAVRRLTY